MKSTARGWRVVIAGTGLNLTFGVLYAWSIFANALTDAQGWSNAQASLPYTVAIIMFATMMIPAGKLQDQIGPRWVSTIGAILIGVGLISASFSPSIPGLIFSFGILAGTGIGLGYAATTPAAIKWFTPKEKGLITGIVVGGFGLASIYIAPLTNYLINQHGIFSSFRILGVIFLVVATIFAQFVRNPEQPIKSASSKNQTIAAEEVSWKDMLKTSQFYMLWFMFFAGATGGLMIIGHLSTIAGLQLGINVGFILVALASIANASGRVIAGIVSDHLGRTKTMAVFYIVQAITFFFFAQFTSFVTILFGAVIVYFVYGSMLSVYPSACSDYYGTKNLGLNYGILFSAWGMGGTVGPLLGGWIADTTNSYDLAFLLAAGLILLASVIGFIIKPYQPSQN